MTFLILYNKTKQNDCARFLMQLLIEIWAKQNVSVQQCNSITEAKKLVINKANAAIVIHHNKPFLSFINLLWLRSIIKKNNIQSLVVFNFSKIYTFPVQQLFVVNTVEKWNDKKPLSSSIKMAVASNKAKQNLLAHHEVPEENILVVPLATESGFKPIDWSEKQSVKMQYAQGKEFFMCSAEGKTPEALMGLLKAFSTFKKWQHSNMKLLLYGSHFFAQKEEWKEKLQTYKYRDDVVLMKDVETNLHAALLASAYAFIHTPMYDEDVMSLLQAMTCETPLISFFTESAKEYADEASIWIEGNNYEQLGEKMILLYKDETLRNTLIEKGKTQGKIYAKQKAELALQAALPLQPFG